MANQRMPTAVQEERDAMRADEWQWGQVEEGLQEARQRRGIDINVDDEEETGDEYGEKEENSSDDLAAQKTLSITDLATARANARTPPFIDMTALQERRTNDRKEQMRNAGFPEILHPADVEDENWDAFLDIAITVFGNQDARSIITPGEGHQNAEDIFPHVLHSYRHGHGKVGEPGMNHPHWANQYTRNLGWITNPQGVPIIFEDGAHHRITATSLPLNALSFQQRRVEIHGDHIYILADNPVDDPVPQPGDIRRRVRGVDIYLKGIRSPLMLPLFG